MPNYVHRSRKSGSSSTVAALLFAFGALATFAHQVRAQDTALSIDFAGPEKKIEVGQQWEVFAKLGANRPSGTDSSYSFAWTLANRSGDPFVQLLDSQGHIKRDPTDRYDWVPGSSIIVKGKKEGAATLKLTKFRTSDQTIEDTAQLVIKVMPLSTFALNPAPPAKLYAGEKFSFNINARNIDNAVLDLKENSVTSSGLGRLEFSKASDPTVRDVKVENVKTNESPEEVTAYSVKPGQVSVMLSGENKPSQNYLLEILQPTIQAAAASNSIIQGQTAKVRAEATFSKSTSFNTDAIVEWVLPNDSPLVLTNTTGTEVQISAPINDKHPALLVEDTAKILIRLKAKDAVLAESPLTLIVRPKAKKITLDSLGSLLVDQEKTIHVHFFSDDNGTEIPEPRQFTFSVVPDKIIGIAKSEDGHGLKVQGLKTGEATLTVSANGESFPIHIEVLTVTDFRELNVLFSPVPYVNARDQYGKEIADQFYVVRLSVLNNLRDERTGKPLGKSALLFADTIRASVIMERRYNPKSGSPEILERALQNPNNRIRITNRQFVWDQTAADAKTAAWAPVTVTDYWRYFNMPPATESAATVTELPLAALNSGQFPPPKPFTMNLPAELTIREGERKRIRALVLDPDGKPVTMLGQDNRQIPVTVEWRSEDNRVASVDNSGLVTGQGAIPFVPETTARPVAGTPPTPVSNSTTLTATYYHVNGQPLATQQVKVIVVPNLSPRQFIYSPFTFDLITGANPLREERETRNRLFNFLRAAGTFGSFLSNVGVLRGSSTTVLEQYSNVLLPGLRQYLPDMRDTQRQNVVRDVMRPVEQVAPGGTLGKVLFFPRNSNPGVIPGYDVRLAGVNVDGMKVDVAIVDRLGTAVSQNDGNNLAANEGSGESPEE